MKPYACRPISLLVGLLLVSAGICVFNVGRTTGNRAMAAPPDGAGLTLYDSNPGHVWNRLHHALHIRETFDDGEREIPLNPEETFDPNDLEPFFWDSYHSYLLSGPAHHEALALLDEFLDYEEETLAMSPLKRALLQRDMWTLFDWLADPDWPKLDEKRRFVKERSELQSRLGRALARLALSAQEIERLPDNYAAAVKAHEYPAAFQADNKTAPFLPADLWDPQGPWVLLGNSAGRPLAEEHISFFGGRSAFMIFLRLPDGRTQTLQYLEQLDEWRRNGANSEVPQFPANTQTALVRRALLRDALGELRTTQLTEQVQLRIVHDPIAFAQRGVQTFLEFRLRRVPLLAGQAGGLRAVPADDSEWDHLS